MKRDSRAIIVALCLECTHVENGACPVCIHRILRGALGQRRGRHRRGGAGVEAVDQRGPAAARGRGHRRGSPTRTGKHERYAEALRLVGAKRSKYALVDLVNWLMAERERMAEALALYRTMRLTPFMDEANNTTAGWMMAFRDYEKAMDAAAGLTGDEIAAAIRGRGK